MARARQDRDRTPRKPRTVNVDLQITTDVPLEKLRTAKWWNDWPLQGFHANLSELHVELAHAMPDKRSGARAARKP